MEKRLRRNKKGQSIIELMVVLAGVVAVLIAVAPNFNQALTSMANSSEEKVNETANLVAENLEVKKW